MPYASSSLPVMNVGVAREPILDIDRLRATPLETNPFQYLIVSDFIRAPAAQAVMADYPVIKHAGSIPLPLLRYGPHFQALIDEMNGDAFRTAIEEKFSIDLKNKPTMFTARGRCRSKDGKVHTDTESKIITVLLYMNHAWDAQGGVLRLLKSKNLDDVAAEVSPALGTLLVFKRSDTSFHGHASFQGIRRAIQMNWVTEQKFVDHEFKRHKRSFVIKKLKSLVIK